MKQKIKNYIYASLLGVSLGIIVYSANGILSTEPVPEHPTITSETLIVKYGSPVSNIAVKLTTMPQESAIPEVAEPEPAPEPVTPLPEPRSIPPLSADCQYEQLE